MNGISFIIITNGKKYDITLESIASITQNVSGKIPYEIILSGDVNKFKDISGITLNHIAELAKVGNLSAMRNRGAEISKYDILFFLDDDVVLDEQWYDNFKKYSEENNFDVYATRMLLPNGDRCWDRAVVFKSYQSMVNYNHNKYDQNLYQTGTYLIIKRDVFMKLKFDETILYYGGVSIDGNIPVNEDVDFSRRLYNAGYCIDFDPNNTIHHIDHTLVQINNVSVKIDDQFNENTPDRGSFWTRYEDIVYMYQEYLGRLPDQEGLARYLFDDKLSSDEIRHALSTSQEHYAYINK